MALGLSSVDGVFGSAAEMQAATINDNRLVGVINNATNPPELTQYITSETQKAGGLLLASGNYANPVPSGGSGSGDMLKAIYDPSNVNADAFNRVNHTGVQAISTISNLQSSLDDKEASLSNPSQNGQVLASTTGGTRSWVSKEDSLGNPSTDGYVLSSTAAGIRSWVAQSGGGGSTNLDYTASPTDGTVTSDTGTDATIPAGSEVNASLMLPADKTKINGIGAGANLVDVVAGTGVTIDKTDPQNPVISSTGGGGGGGKSLPYTLSGSGSEVVGVGGRRSTSIVFQVPVSLSAVPSSATMSGSLRGSFYRNDTNSVGSQTFDLATDVTYDAATSTVDMLQFTATVTDTGYSAWGRIAGSGAAWSIQLNV